MFRVFRSVTAHLLLTIFFSAQLMAFEKKPSGSIWSELTQFEIDTLNKAKQRDHLDNPDLLLALSLIASGDTRHYQNYHAIQGIINHFVEKLQPVIAQQENTWLKGYHLHTAMHDRFFLENNRAFELDGYEADQSQVSQIFQRKTYNCTSSTLLYLILAKHFDLDVQAVILPSHTFVQLNTPEGKPIEIETTSKQGYGLRHTPEFYKNDAKNWSRLRALAPIRYEDYLNRTFTSTYELIAENMNHQHTVQRISETDRYRLQEIRAWLMPDDLEAQTNRIYVLNNQLIRLKKSGNYSDAQALIAKALNSIDYWQQRKNAQQPIAETIYSIIAFIISSQADIAINQKDNLGAIKFYKKALKWAKDKKQIKQYQHNIAVAYLNLGNQHFSKNQYQQAINYYAQVLADKTLSLETNTRLGSKLSHNIGVSYWNMAVPELNKGNSYQAYQLLHTCLQRFPENQQCKQHLNKLCQRYSLPGCSN